MGRGQGPQDLHEQDFGRTIGRDTGLRGTGVREWGSHRDTEGGWAGFTPTPTPPIVSIYSSSRVLGRVRNMKNPGIPLSYRGQSCTVPSFFLENRLPPKGGVGGRHAASTNPCVVRILFWCQRAQPSVVRGTNRTLARFCCFDAPAMIKSCVVLAVAILAGTMPKNMRPPEGVESWLM